MEKVTSSRILFVHAPTFGLQHDAAIFAKALSRSLRNAEFFSVQLPVYSPKNSQIKLPKWLQELLPFRLVVFLQHLVPCEELYDPDYCKYRVFIPNSEWLLPNDESLLSKHPLDAILYKTRLAESIIDTLPVVRRTPIRMFTGWTSRDIGEQVGAGSSSTDFTKFIHVRGVSDQKQTEVLIEAWLANPALPRITIVGHTRDAFSVPVPLLAAPNVEIILRKLESTELRTLQRTCGVHICPSLMEGFGHSLNEARSIGALLVTTDGPPMSDFVIPKVSGMLVPVHSSDVRTIRRSPAYPIRAGELARTVLMVHDMSYAERKKMGTVAREQFLRDRQYFQEAIISVLGKVGLLPN